MKEVVTTQWGGRTLSIETGQLAKQANGSVLVRYGESAVLVTATAAKTPREGIDFFPLSVDYLEMTYAAGKIPGGFFKREGRPSEREVLVSRFIDRPLRPLFPEHFRNDVQIIATVLSADDENDPDVVAIAGASAALEISDIPFNGPIAGVRIGRINDTFVINPPLSIMKDSDIDLIVAGSEEAVVMVEGSARGVPEAVVLDAIMFGHRSLQDVIQLQRELRAKVGKPKLSVAAPDMPQDLVIQVRQRAEPAIRQALSISTKLDRNAALRAVMQEIVEEFTHTAGEAMQPTVRSILEALHEEIIRSMILEQGKRIDGRSPTDIRPISCDVGVLPRTHGSGLFTRGETQVMVTTTLGTAQDEQRIDSLIGESSKAFMLHYNFPPFCVGEVRPLRAPSRREIGHGNLAERAIIPVLPSADTFPYTIRIVSEVLESNGSSSMATVCGSILSLMDAGVPIKEPVAGIAMGLVKEGERFVVLSDILGDEDHVGDMDFKVAGTRTGVTAIQMDIKIAGLTRDILTTALEQARIGRLHILDIMMNTIAAPRPEISPRAPRIATLQVKPDKISTIIGPGGKTIKGIIAQTGVKIDVEDDGKVTVASPDKASIEQAIQMIRGLIEEAEIGKTYLGTVRRITDFGAFVEILPGIDGLIHISQLDTKRVNNVRDILKEGDEVLVKVLDIDAQGKIRLSRKAVLAEKSPRS
ncbi:MAG: polyribonucleotide nucleotidyltransferase [Desulfobacterota bacterium]|nr:polyribonucleotide nucleotidyltransferase [Thermodesulfobacteriota bacterium]